MVINTTKSIGVIITPKFEIFSSMSYLLLMLLIHIIKLDKLSYYLNQDGFIFFKTNKKKMLNAIELNKIDKLWKKIYKINSKSIC